MNPDTHTLGEVLRATASAQPHKLALVGEGARYTWSSLDQRVDRLAGGLQALGVSKGDLIGLCIAKRPELVLMFLAAARLGALVAPINYKIVNGSLYTQYEPKSPQSMPPDSNVDTIPRFELVAIASLKASVKIT